MRLPFLGDKIYALTAVPPNYDNIPHQIVGIKGLFDVQLSWSSSDVVCDILDIEDTRDCNSGMNGSLWR